MGAIAALLAVTLGATVLPSDDHVVVTSDPTGITTVVNTQQPGASKPTTSVQDSANTVTCSWDLDEGLNEVLRSAAAGTDLAAQYAAGGRFFDIACSDGSFTMGVYVPPGGPVVPGPVTSQGLAFLARNRLPLPAPRAEHNPPGEGLVGLATWWWLPRSQWQTLRQRTAAGSVWAEVTARPVVSRWSAGDGTPVLVCPGAGTAYDTSRPTASQATRCFHTYRRSSAAQRQSGRDANDRFYTVTVTVTWAVTWRGSDGSRGSLPTITRSSQFALRVAERQTVVTDSRD